MFEECEERKDTRWVSNVKRSLASFSWKGGSSAIVLVVVEVCILLGRESEENPWNSVDALPNNDIVVGKSHCAISSCDQAKQAGIYIISILKCTAPPLGHCALMRCT